MEFINHFGLSVVGTHLLIYCQIVGGGVVSALGAGRGRRLVTIPWCCGQSPGRERSLPWTGGSSCLSLPHCRKGWSSTLLRQPVLIAAKSAAFGTSLALS